MPPVEAPKAQEQSAPSTEGPPPTRLRTGQRESFTLPRIALCLSAKGCVPRKAPDSAKVEDNGLIGALRAGEELAIVEHWQRDEEGWFRHEHYESWFASVYPASFELDGQSWYIIGGTINGASRGEVIASTNAKLMERIVAEWPSLDGVARIKAMSRLWQPSSKGEQFKLRMLVIDDPVHDGDAILSQSGLKTLRIAFDQPKAKCFKVTGSAYKAVLRRFHPKWDELPSDVEVRGLELFHRGQPIDGVLFRDCVKIGKPEPGSVIALTEDDIRLHSTEARTNSHSAGIGRQLLQYLPAELAARIVAASDIPLNASRWCRAVSGDAEALRYLIGLSDEDGESDYETRSQLERHLRAGCRDVSGPYMRRRALHLLNGIFKTRVRKGRCPGAFLFVAPSTRLGPYEISVPANMLNHDERERVHRGESIKLLACRYPLTGHSSINALEIAGVHGGAVVYGNPTTWKHSFQGDFDGDCISLFKVDPTGWRNSRPWVPPATPPAQPIGTPQALEQAARSKEDVALGETLLADHIARCWEQGELEPEHINELGTRLVCAAVDRAKHGHVEWGITPAEFGKRYRQADDERHPLLQAGAKSFARCESPEAELKARLFTIKEVPAGAQRSGWELLIALLQGWLAGVEVIPEGDHTSLYQRILHLHAALPTPDRAIMAKVFAIRGGWRRCVDAWKRTGDDAAMKDFMQRFEGWIETEDSVLTTSVLLELGRQLLRPGAKGNASLFMTMAPDGLLKRIYGA